MSLSQYTDAQLEAIASSGSAASSMSDEELKRIAGEPEGPADSRSFGEKATDFALDALPSAGALAGGSVGALAGGGVASIPGAAAGGAGGYMLGSDARDLISDFIGRSRNKVTDGTQRVGEVLGNAGKGAIIGATGPALKGAISSVPSIAESIATSPIPMQLAKATDIAGRMGSPVAGRFAAYSVPGARTVQGFSDSMIAVQGVQKGIAHILDHTPEALGKFFNVIKSAADRGPEALAVTDFLLSQKNPEYQQMKKRLHDQ